MAVDAPRNNLQDVLRRNASGQASSTPTMSTAQSTGEKVSKVIRSTCIGTNESICQKFKPAKPVKPFPAPCLSPSLPRPQRRRLLTTVDSAMIIPMLDDDITPGGSSGVSRPLSPVRTPQKKIRQVIDLSSPDLPSSGSSIPKKRNSSEIPEPFGSPSSALKRTKWGAPAANKENHFCGGSPAPGEGNGIAMSDFGEPALLRTGRGKAKEPPTPRRRKPNTFSADSAPETTLSNDDLSTVRQASIKQLMLFNDYSEILI
jgi:hypothetical protein